MVEAESDLTSQEHICLQRFERFFLELETTKMVKCFKMVLLEAFLELDGFSAPVDENTLAQRSYQILLRRKPLHKDLPEKFKNGDSKDRTLEQSWKNYWHGNPINAWIGGNRGQGEYFFSVALNLFKFHEKVSSRELDTLSLMVQEIVDFRLLQYEERPKQQQQEEKSTTTAEIIEFPSVEGTVIPYFSDLQIACGHFATTSHVDENIEYRELPITYGSLDPAYHFIARAKGNSMNGGKSPICDGDYLLLERITPNSAGSISSGNSILVTEIQDIVGDDQYLLRRVKKIGPGNYQLLADNPDYEPIMATEDMRTLARLKGKIDSGDLRFP